MAETKGYLRHLQIRGAVGEFRVAQYEGREHVVLPVVACMEAVIRPLNSDGPEFVPADVLAIAPGGWNGRPCVGPHPLESENKAGSANDPRSLERLSFGQIFNAQFDSDTRQLKVEAWLDPAKALIVGEDAMSVIRRARDKETIEVSIGAFVISDHEPGSYLGEPYEYIWRLAIPDHLALLPPNQRGACSYEMGCGVRAAAYSASLVIDGRKVEDQHDPHDLPEASVTRDERIAALVAAGFATESVLEKLSDDQIAACQFKSSAISNVQQAADSAQKTSVGAKLLSLLGVTAAQKYDRMSDDDIRSVLSTMLSSEDRNFRGVQAVYPHKNEVVYLTDPDPGGPGALQLRRRKYEIADDGTCELKGQAKPVRPVVSFEDLTAGEDADTKAAFDKPCGCKKAAAEAAKTEDNVEHRNAQRIKSLIEHPKTPWTVAEQAVLEAMSDERLAEVEKFIPADEKKEETIVETKTEPKVEAAAETVVAPKTLAEVDMKALPKPVQEHFAKLAAREQAAKDELVGVLVENQKIFTKPQLAAKSLDELKQIAQLAGLTGEAVDEDVDFSVVGAHRAAESDAYTAPDPWEKALAARAAKQ